MNQPLHPSTTTVVVSRYQESTDWIVPLTKMFPTTLVYEKEKPGSNPYNIPVNKGNEASVYLKYIIDHYDQLPIHTIFLHCHEFSWHQEGSMLTRLAAELDKPHAFTNLNHYRMGDMTDLDTDESDLGLFYRTYLTPAVGPNVMHPNFTKDRLGCAQFIVHRSRILWHTREFYEQLYHYLLTTHVDNYWSGRYLEWTWELMWELCGLHFPIKVYQGEQVTSCSSPDLLQTLRQRGFVQNNTPNPLTIVLSTSALRQRIAMIPPGIYLYFKVV
jgi:hypothetical protein